MQIMITGAGDVGYHLARQLSDSYDVIVIDENSKACERLDGIDVRVLQGNAANAQILIEAGLQNSDMVVAVTGNDEVNIITCITASHLGVDRTIARVSNSDYIDQPMKDRRQIGIGLMICPELVMAERIVKDLYFPSMIERRRLAGGKAELIELAVGEDAPFKGTIGSVDLPENCKLAAIKRGEEVLIPRKEGSIKAGDRLILTCDARSVPKLRKLIHEETASHKVMIVGGGVVGFYLAKWLEKMDFDLKLVEIDNERCQKLAEELPDTLILNGDGTDISLIKAENVGSMDAVFSVTGFDEKNLLCSLLAKQLGADKIVARVDRSDYIDLFEMVGVDNAISPGRVTVEAVLRLIRGGEEAVPMGKDEAEVLDFRAEKEAKILGKNAAEKMPKGAILGMVMRGNQPVIPTTETEVKEGDRVFILALPQVLPQVKALFSTERSA
ncbi:Trk system potassium transporter TrkA [Methanotrichaceae archaeon M04Ac]|uniref:Trk system potassium transporter TrkA n=1 Tax=Candidatus Methanocrinis alkalitolerans TaxID=3033395 RepID=A0ABT5XED1_9EURY|nr:Trk system potassium transporter TrkA [Candidatus Methanocrinis alkalitolerans]MCR3883921.1 Trk system potassium transporter TrkA [Methanothrix sp.]MDF0593077.1 Trk system potassium transporter TrkA [Candidatus Methanocrinis alkalitolerans]